MSSSRKKFHELYTYFLNSGHDPNSAAAAAIARLQAITEGGLQPPLAKRVRCSDQEEILRTISVPSVLTANPRTLAATCIQRRLRGILGRQKFIKLQHASIKSFIEKNFQEDVENWHQENAKPQVMSILGPVPSSLLGNVVCREHIYHTLDQSNNSSLEKPRKSPQSLCLSNLAYLNANPFSLQKNLTLGVDSIVGYMAVETEIEEYKRSGGCVMVETTPQGRGRNISCLIQLAFNFCLNNGKGNNNMVIDNDVSKEKNIKQERQNNNMEIDSDALEEKNIKKDQTMNPNPNPKSFHLVVGNVVLEEEDKKKWTTKKQNEIQNETSKIANHFIEELTVGMKRDKELDPDWSCCIPYDGQYNRALQYACYPRACAGIIGEIILNDYSNPNPNPSNKYSKAFQKNQILLEAAAFAQNNVPGNPSILIVVPMWMNAIRIANDAINILENAGVDLSRVIISGISSWCTVSPISQQIRNSLGTKFDTKKEKSILNLPSAGIPMIDSLQELLDRGVNICIDIYGCEVISYDTSYQKNSRNPNPSNNPNPTNTHLGMNYSICQPWPLPSEEEVARAVAYLSSKRSTYSKKIILGQATLFQTQLVKNGSFGYTRILNSFIPRLFRLGMEYSIIENMIHILSWWLPSPPKTIRTYWWECDQCQRRFIEGSIQFSRMSFRYCSMVCLHKHRRGVIAFNNASKRRKEDENRGNRGGGNVRSRHSSSWSIKT